MYVCITSRHAELCAVSGTTGNSQLLSTEFVLSIHSSESQTMRHWTAIHHKMESQACVRMAYNSTYCMTTLILTQAGDASCAPRQRHSKQECWLELQLLPFALAAAAAEVAGEATMTWPGYTGLATTRKL